ncbi:unnamed protein product, partial [Soboliphyme baturini]|uniref:WD_REPEATS_REGION domain-containing protein n=1 Tax=Soboliphyme baturini TaxID=241478 RepID=A0A183J4I2_9BILA
KTKQLTPSRNPDVSATASPGGDRYIPNRSVTQLELGHYLMQSCNERTGTGTVKLDPEKLEYQRLMSAALNGGVTAIDKSTSDSTADDSSNFNILAFQKTKAPQVTLGHVNNNKVLYSSRVAPVSVYLNLLDWNQSNILAVGLSGHLYLWNAETGGIDLLLELNGVSEYVSSLSWATSSSYLAVGLSSGAVQIWDVAAHRKLRTMVGHQARVGSLAWNEHILCSGCRDGTINQHDVRIADHLQSVLRGHTQEVCGLRWSPDGRYLASGGNDNLLNIWSKDLTGYTADPQPVYTFTEHQAAVKAVAWCPWLSHVLATGGGTADRHIRFWNCNTGMALSSVDTKSQICALLWSKEHMEIISGHGYPSFQLCVWKYPKMTKVAELIGHTSRVLHMAMSPCGEFVVSAAADETLRIWHCFATDPARKKTEQVAKKTNLFDGPSGTFGPTSIR